jgi:dolichyl-phosphate beta-glucosyltransferase
MKLSIQLSRYIITGGLTTLIDLFFLYVFVEYAHLSVLYATAFAFFIAVVFSFAVNGLWTFQMKKQLQLLHFLRFLFVSLIGFALTIGSMYIFLEKIPYIEIHYMIAKIITSLIVLAWNFIGNSLWTFASRNTQKTPEIFAPLPKNSDSFPFELSLVIPAYNEEKRIEKTLHEAKKYFDDEINISWELIIANDGSKDNTQKIAEKFLHDQKIAGKVLSITPNQGKGNAVKTGIQEASGKYILFADADGSTPFKEYQSLKDKLITEKYHFVIGSRYKQKNSILQPQPFYRRFFSRSINFFLQIFLIDGVADSQCGFKLFRNEVAKTIFPFQKIKRFAFDVEALMIGEKLGYQYQEIPVEWHDQDGSTFSFIHGVHSIWDFIRIRFFITFHLYPNLIVFNGNANK